MKIRSALRFFLCMALLQVPGFAAAAAVEWSARLDPAGARAGEGARVLLEAKIEEPYHLYSTTPIEGGPVATKIGLVKNPALAEAGKVVQPPGKKERDPNFNVDVEYYAKGVIFGIPVKLSPGLSGVRKVKVSVIFQACTDRLCLPPRTVEVPLQFTVSAGPARADRLQPNAAVPPQPEVTSLPEAGPTPTGGNAASTRDSFNQRLHEAQQGGLLPFLWLALSMGFLALLTPCVFPMIPITVSFFSKTNEASRREGIKGAVAYCVGIIATFTALGLLLSALFGATGIQKFATNPIVNLGMALLFIVLAINLFGVFEIQMPAWMVERAQSGTGRGRFIGPLLMGLTFTLTSFTCTVPFVGTLLVSTSQGSWFWPIVGMLAFSAAFASPFFLLALFPQWLARMPKSGPWLVSVKATMGFLELAAAVKFLSNADLIWERQFLTRPVFLAIWAGIAAVAAFYLLGWVRLPHALGKLRIGPVRRILGYGMAVAGLYCLAAINGASLGELSAYLPPAGYGQEGVKTAIPWVKDYEAAVQQAKSQGKPLFINFTGYTCTNCRFMEENILTRPEVATAIGRFVPAELFTDGQGPEYVRNQKLEQDLFGTVALPLYAVVTADGRTIDAFPGLTRNAKEFVTFLEQSFARATAGGQQSALAR